MTHIAFISHIKEYNVVGMLENFFNHILYTKYILFLNVKHRII